MLVPCCQRSRDLLYKLLVKDTLLRSIAVLKSDACTEITAIPELLGNKSLGII